MERTELREQFFAEAKTDPWTHAVVHHAANLWAMGYEQALRDNGLSEQRLRETHSERVERAVAWITDEQRASQAKMVVALASAGRLTANDLLRR